MKIFKIVPFSEWANEHRVSDQVLIDAISEMNNGLFDANLGGNVYKKRIPLDNKQQLSVSKSGLIKSVFQSA